LAYASAQVGPGPSGQTLRWQARRGVGRALAPARLQEERLRQRAPRAVEDSNALHERQQGQQRRATDAAALQAAAAMSTQPRVAAVVPIGVQTTGREATKRRYGQRPAQPRRPTTVQAEARLAQAAMAQAIRRCGWRVDATPHAQETMPLTPVVAASRRADRVAQSMRRVNGRSLSLTPLSWQCAPRSVGLIFLLSIALRVLVLRQCVAREHVQQEGTTRTGISPGQPGRPTTRPPTEMLRPVCRGITLSRMTVHGETSEHLTPLTPVQERIVELIGLPLETFSRLAPQLSKTDFHSHEP
jgi:hypothetical protein